MAYVLVKHFSSLKLIFRELLLRFIYPNLLSDGGHIFLDLDLMLCLEPGECEGPDDSVSHHEGHESYVTHQELKDTLYI